MSRITAIELLPPEADPDDWYIQECDGGRNTLFVHPKHEAKARELCGLPKGDEETWS